MEHLLIFVLAHDCSPETLATLVDKASHETFTTRFLLDKAQASAFFALENSRAEDAIVTTGDQLLSDSLTAAKLSSSSKVLYLTSYDFENLDLTSLTEFAKEDAELLVLADEMKMYQSQDWLAEHFGDSCYHSLTGKMISIALLNKVAVSDNLSELLSSLYLQASSIKMLAGVWSKAPAYSWKKWGEQPLAYSPDAADFEEVLTLLALKGKDSQKVQTAYRKYLSESSNQALFAGDMVSYQKLSFKAKSLPYTIKVKPIMETLDYINAHHPSVVRFGDGEMDIIAGHGIAYQTYHKDLANELRYLLGLESSDSFLVCQSDVFEHLERYTGDSQWFWRQHLAAQDALYRATCTASWYGSTFISRPYMVLEDKTPAKEHFAKLKRLWQGQRLLIVEGVTSRSGVGNDLFAEAKSIKRIICPAQNAYDKIDEIEDAILAIEDVDLVLLMLGPTAKVLVHRLSQKDLWAVDLGHIDSEYEWFKMGATSKVKLSHKHTAEHNYDENIVFDDDDDYQAQIITRIEGE